MDILSARANKRCWSVYLLNERFRYRIEGVDTFRALKVREGVAKHSRIESGGSLKECKCIPLIKACVYTFIF